MPIGIIVAIFGLGLIIFVHELGHFLGGKLLKLKITEFFIGLPIGRSILKFKRGETEYGIKPVLFGGYVKFPEYLALNDPVIDHVAPDSPGMKAGLRKDDVIKEFGSQKIETWLDVYESVTRSAGRTVEIKLERDGAEETVNVKLDTRDDRGYLGVGPASSDDISIEDLPDTLEGQSLWRKIMVVAAGPVMNLALAIVLIAGAMMVGFSEPTTTIGRIIPDSPAQSADLKQGDRIVAIAGQKTGDWQSVIQTIKKNAGKKVVVKVERGGRQLSSSVELRKESKEGLLGVSTKLERNPRGFTESIAGSATFTYQATQIILGLMYELVTSPGDVVGQLRSPIGVVQETAPIAQRDMTEYIITLAGISIAIGIFNFLPIPPLDGGRIFISGIEFITRRRIRKESLMFINAVGVSLLLVLMTYVIAADLFRIARPGGG